MKSDIIVYEFNWKPQLEQEGTVILSSGAGANVVSGKTVVLIKTIPLMTIWSPKIIIPIPINFLFLLNHSSIFIEMI